MTAPARRLSPAGGGALCVFRVERAALGDELALVDAHGRARAWPEAGRWCVASLLHRGRRVDEVLVLGRATSIEVHGHGAPLVTAGLADALGAAEVDVVDSDVEAAARSLRGVRALGSARHGPLAALLTALAAGDPAARASDECARAHALLDFGARLVRPPRVRLVGRANAGKSTLFNRLGGAPRALVSDREGTTRDTVAQELLVAGVPVRLEDAAGCAPADAPRAGADLLVHLLRDLDEEPLGGEVPCLRVLGRADDRSPAELAAGPAVSGLTGAGCDALIAATARILALDRPADDDLWTPVLAADRALVAAVAPA